MEEREPVRESEDAEQTGEVEGHSFREPVREPVRQADDDGGDDVEAHSFREPVR